MAGLLCHSNILKLNNINKKGDAFLMRSIMKKAFSLLLIGVVTVSMFSFIRPNCVDAAGKLQCMKVIIDRSMLSDGASKEDGYFTFVFFDKNKNEIGGGIRTIRFYTTDVNRKNQIIELPETAKSLTVKILNPTIVGQKKRIQTTVTALIHNVYKSAERDCPFIEINIYPTAVNMVSNPYDCRVVSHYTDRV